MSTNSTKYASFTDLYVSGDRTDLQSGKDDARPLWLEDLSISVTSDPAQFESEWRSLEQYASVPFSNYDWATAWYKAHKDNPNVSPAVVLGRNGNGQPEFLLPFVRERRGPFKVLLWPGGTHAAYHCGLFSPECRDVLMAGDTKQFWRRILAELPRADAVAGYGLPSFEISNHTPLLGLPLFESSCSSYRVTMGDDWETFSRSSTSNKLRANDRRCERRMAEHGQLSFHVATGIEACRQFLETLIAQKSEYFDRCGIANFFETRETREFYERLVANREKPVGGSVFLSALQLDGQIIAVNLGMIHDQTFHGMVLSRTNSDIERFGPGRLLLRRSMEHLCRQGIRHYDFGAGENRFKNQWHGEQVKRCDILVGLNAKGWFFVRGFRLFLAVKATIKRSPVLWRLFSRYRKHLSC